MKALTKYECLCSKCSCIKTYTEPVRKRNRETLCKECSAKKRTKPKGRFKRVCDTCGDVKITDRYVKATTCVKCTKKMLGAILVTNRSRESYGGKTSYTYFCHTCPSVRVLSARRDTNYCITCSRKYFQKKKIESVYFDMEEMMYKVPTRFYRVCKHCGDTKQVKQSLYAGLKTCAKCRHLDIDQEKVSAKRKKTLKANGTKAGRKKGVTSVKVKPKTTHYSEEAIEKTREKNRKHREAQAKPKPKNKVKRTEEEKRKWEQEQIEKFIASNKVIQLEDNKVSDNFFNNTFK